LDRSDSAERERRRVLFALRTRFRGTVGNPAVMGNNRLQRELWRQWMQAAMRKMRPIRSCKVPGEQPGDVSRPSLD